MKIAFLVPGPLEARTGGSIYDSRMAAALRARGWQVHVIELDPGFPYPARAAVDRASRALASLDAGTVVVVDSLAFGAMPDAIAREGARLRIVALMHLPLAATPGLDRDMAARFEAGERQALAAATLVVITGKAAVPLLARYNLPPDRLVIVEPGTDRAPLARGSESEYVASGSNRTIELLCVGTLNVVKGHDMLLRALAALRDHDWHLTCAGSLTRDPDTAERVRVIIAESGLDGRVTLAGDLDRRALAACYERADLFVLATQQETYGMAVAEALAHGVPVVATMTGAIPELVGRDAGLLVPVGDASAMTAALRRVLEDAALRARLAEGARRVRDGLSTWDEAAGRMAAALASIDDHG